LDAHNPDVVNQIFEVQALEASPTLQDYEIFKHFLACAPADTIKRSLVVTTQYVRGIVSDNLQQHWTSCFPDCHFTRCNEVVGSDTVFSDTPTFFHWRYQGC
jgi:hypothetical protein